MVGLATNCRQQRLKVAKTFLFYFQSCRKVVVVVVVVLDLFVSCGLDHFVHEQSAFYRLNFSFPSYFSFFRGSEICP